LRLGPTKLAFDVGEVLLQPIRTTSLHDLRLLARTPDKRSPRLENLRTSCGCPSNASSTNVDLAVPGHRLAFPGAPDSKPTRRRFDGWGSTTF
jgi:hypothetical protein